MSKKIVNLLKSIIEKYPEEKKRKMMNESLSEYPKSEQPAFNLLEHDASEILGEYLDEYKIEGRTGSPRWQNIPFISIFDNEITTTSSKGFYLVYLFKENKNNNNKGVYLCFAFGTRFFDKYGGCRYEYLNSCIQKMRNRLNRELKIDYNSFLEEIDLESEDKNAKSYEKSIVYALEYTLNDLRTLSDEHLKNDLDIFTKLYQCAKKNYCDELTITTNEWNNLIKNKKISPDLLDELNKLCNDPYEISHNDLINNNLDNPKLLELITLETKNILKYLNKEPVYLKKNINTDISQKKEIPWAWFLDRGEKYELTTNLKNTLLKLNEEDEKMSFTDFNEKKIEPLLYDPKLLNRISASLNAGDHIILEGAPGTGKTELSIKISEYAIEKKLCDDFVLTTATSDWNTFDTIGGFMPDQDGKLIFYEGKFLEAIHKNNWLIIDEINRADIDKAFGPLFTVLSGQDIELPYKNKENKTIKIKRTTENDSYYEYCSGTYYIGKNWRIIGTMNNFDKDSLFELSYAFMRRFSFISVKFPENKYKDIIDDWNKNFNENDPESNNDLINKIKKITEINKYRELGPAIFKDMVKYITFYSKTISEEENNDDIDILKDSVISYLIPQFEGLDYDNLCKIYTFLSQEQICEKNDEIYLKLENFAGKELKLKNIEDEENNDEME